MKKFLLLLAIAFSFSSCDVLQEVADNVLSEPTIEEIGRGLKEALTKGVTKGANELSVRDGFYKSAYKILLPQEVRGVTQKLRSVPGFERLEENLLEKINRGAEEAAKEAGPIFVSSIRRMTFKDATNILMGSDNAATQYLRSTTTNQLYSAFKPRMVNALNKVGANELWRKATTAYNKIPLVNKVNTDLGDYVTKEALKGLFAKIELEEKNIRRNPRARSSALLQKVFAKQDR